MGRPCLGFSTAWGSRETKSIHAAERETPRVQQASATYRQLMVWLDLRRLQYLDEAGVNLAMTRLYERAPDDAPLNMPIGYG